ncbi:MAG TPA: acyl-CoA reductase [Chitinophagaceae bacterium]|nr:acyl-CoA reductase [Chitinophagaceae bacterium]
MNLQYRVDLLVRLGDYILAGTESSWAAAKEQAFHENNWFIPEFVESACRHIAHSFLQRETLENWIRQYDLPPENKNPKTIGIVMAGNIPLVGFHDLLTVFISGHKALVKPSSKDEALVKHLVAKLTEWDKETSELIRFSALLKGCDAYIATGSNNTAGYFDYYFGKYPHIIRRNRTSVAILDGKESAGELAKLADDVYLYFGLGCRNVTKIYVPKDYDFYPLIQAFSRYDWMAEHHKYKHNYDYNLAILILNKKFYMSNSSLLLVEDPSLFSPISRLNYEFYRDRDKLTGDLKQNPQLQCIVGREEIVFGQSQHPGIADYADGADTLQFVSRL